MNKWALMCGLVGSSCFYVGLICGEVWYFIDDLRHFLNLKKQDKKSKKEEVEK